MEANSKKISIKSGTQKEIFLSDFFDDFCTTITVQKDAYLDLKIVIFDKIEKPDIQFKIILKENAVANIAVADFSGCSFNFTSLVKLEERGAKATWKLSSLSKDNDKKNFDISFIHEEKETTSDLQCYGVGTNNSKLVFKGVSHILNGASKSTANQQAKIIIFDDGVDASSSPSLRIDENDVNASHSAVVGRLNDDHLYYLMSRGLTETEARKLIIYGYLSPIAEYFEGEARDQILASIKEKF